MNEVRVTRPVLRVCLLLGQPTSMALEAHDEGGLALGAADFDALLNVPVAQSADPGPQESLEILDDSQETLILYRQIVIGECILTLHGEGHDRLD